MNRKNLILIDKTIVRILFFFAAVSARFRRTQVDIPPRLPRRPQFAVIRPGGLGDGIMSIPFLRCLRREFPTSRITLVCVTKNRAVFDLISYHDELVVLDDLTHTIQQLWRLNRTKLDVLFDLEPFRRTSSLVSWLSGAKTRVGFDTNSRRKLYTHFVTYAEDSCSESENMLNQLAVVGKHPRPGVGRSNQPIDGLARSRDFQRGAFGPQPRRFTKRPGNNLGLHAKVFDAPVN